MTDISDTGRPRGTSAGATPPGAAPVGETGSAPETAGATARREPSTNTRHQVREDYGFACLHCGHAWEQSYDIEHHLDRDNKPFFRYFTNGERVPSPLSTLTCLNCLEHRVLITGSQRVSAVRSAYAPGWPYSR